MMELYSKMMVREEGQTLAEYAVVLGVIALLIVAALTGLRTAIEGALNAVAGIV
jgi:Flp pilus assembly pilin Flp